MSSWTWMLLAIGVAISLGGAVLFAWAIFRDRARGRRRCPRCWYDMSGAPGGGMTCPECGRTQKNEHRFGRTRRRWRWAVAGLGLVLLGAGTAIGFGTAADPLLALVPPRVWVDVLPLFDDQAKKVYDTRYSRGVAAMMPAVGAPPPPGVPLAAPPGSPAPGGTSVTYSSTTGAINAAGPSPSATQAAALAAAMTQSMMGARTGYTRWERLLIARRLAVKARAGDFGAVGSPYELLSGLRTAAEASAVTIVMLTRALRDPDEAVRASAASSLGIVLGTERSESAAAVLVAGQTTSGAAMVGGQVVEIPPHKEPERTPLCPPRLWGPAVKTLAQMVSHDPDGGARVMAMWALYKAEPGVTHQDEMIVALGDESDDARLQASEMVRRLGAQARPASAAVIARLGDRNELVRSRACQTLESIGALPEAIAGLARLVETDTDPAVRCFAVRALGVCGAGDKRAIRALGKALGDDQRDVRIAAARCLAEAGAPAAVVREELQRAMQDPLPQVRELAARALEAIDASK